MEATTPQIIFYLFGLPITDTVVSTWVMMLVVIVIAAIIRKYRLDIAERLIEMINGIISSVMPEDAKVMQYLPLLGTLMIFLLFGNIFSIFPHDGLAHREYQHDFCPGCHCVLRSPFIWH